MTTNGQAVPNVKAETIVVGVDLTASGLAALEEALRRGAAPNVTVHVVYALDQSADSSFADGLPRAEKALAEASDRLREHLDRAQALEIFGRGVQAHVRLEAPVEAILQLAVDVDADLIVVGAEKREGRTAILHSSVGTAVAHQAHCPVLVARPKDYSDLSKTPRIQPACPACREARLATNYESMWCAQHQQERHFARHTYSYSRELPLRDRPPHRELDRHLASPSLRTPASNRISRSFSPKRRPPRSQLALLAVRSSDAVSLEKSLRSSAGRRRHERRRGAPRWGSQCPALPASGSCFRPFIAPR